MDGPESDLIPDAVLDRNAIEFTVDEVTDIDREGRTVKTAAGKRSVTNGLILATGSVPIVPPYPGWTRRTSLPSKRRSLT